MGDYSSFAMPFFQENRLAFVCVFQLVFEGHFAVFPRFQQSLWLQIQPIRLFFPRYLLLLLFLLLQYQRLLHHPLNREE